MPSYEVKGPSGHFHTSCYAEATELIVLHLENSHFSMVTSSLLHPKYEPLGSNIAHSATTAAVSSPFVANRCVHQTVAGLLFGAQDGQRCHLFLSSHRHGEFIACVVVNTWNRWVPRRVDLVIPPLKQTNTEFSPRREGCTVEERLSRRSLTGLKNRICAAPWCSANSSGEYCFRHLAAKHAII